MNLVIDIGNSRIKWALVSDDGWQRGAAMHGGRVASVLQGQWQDLPTPSRVLVANVAGPAAAAAISSWTQANWSLDPEFFRAQKESLGIINGYEDPEQLGCDRWAALLGARALHSGALGVVDCGTAITLDLLDSRDCHRGGVIVPGLELAQDCLLHRTAGIQERTTAPKSLLGRNTADGVTNGVYHWIAGGLENMMHKLDTVLDREPCWLLTGGDAARVAGMLDRSLRVEPDLVLHGLSRYLEQRT